MWLALLFFKQIYFLVTHRQLYYNVLHLYLLTDKSVIQLSAVSLNKLLIAVDRLLGIDKLVLYAVNEWAMDIKKTQLPSLLGGVGPMHSLVQLGM